MSVLRIQTANEYARLRVEEVKAFWIHFFISLLSITCISSIVFLGLYFWRGWSYLYLIPLALLLIIHSMYAFTGEYTKPQEEAKETVREAMKLFKRFLCDYEEAFPEFSILFPSLEERREFARKWYLKQEDVEFKGCVLDVFFKLVEKMHDELTVSKKKFIDAINRTIDIAKQDMNAEDENGG